MTRARAPVPPVPASTVLTMECPLSIFILALCTHFAAAGFGGYSTDIECYQRVAVGKRLNSTEVSSSQALATVRQCEQECERATCHAFAFGVSPGGNGTCELAASAPKGESVVDIDYDLFYKNEKCLNRTSCYKRLAVGRSLVDRYVKRELFCDSLRACEEACAFESAFQCEGFNFKFDKIGFESKCQLTNIPSSKLSLTTDFNSDVDFDFFEKDRSAPRSCHAPPPPPWGGGSWEGRPWGGGDGVNWLPDEGAGQQLGHHNHRPPPPDFYDDRGHRPPPPADYNNHNQIAGPAWNEPERFGDKGFDFGGGHQAWLGNGVGSSDECFVRIRTGFRLDRGVMSLSIAVPSLYDCEYECVNQRKFTCNAFAFRYSSLPGGDNCQMSERFYGVMDTYVDILPDRDFDLYDRNPNGREGCQPKRFWGSDCFERVKSGLKLKDSTTKFSIKVSSLSECEAACINMPYFTCRAFSFRYGPPTIGDREDNCLLTDWTMSDKFNLDRDFAIDAECELYYRGSYGHGCEIGRYPEYPRPGGFERPSPPPVDDRRPGGYLPPPRPERPLPERPLPERPPPGDNFIPLDKPGPGYLPADPPQFAPPGRESGYLPPRRPNPGYLPSDRAPPPRRPEGDGFPIKPRPYLPPSNGEFQPLNPPERPSGAYLPSPAKPDRRYLPTKGKYPYDYRKNDNFNRGSYYPITQPGDNRYLPPQQPIYGVKGYPPKISDELCYIRSGAPARLLPSAVKVAMWCPSEQQCKDECSRAREKTRFRCSTISYRDGQCELSDVEQRDLRIGYDYLEDKEFWMFTWDFGTPNCYYPPQTGNRLLLNNPSVYADRGVAETWAHFTVNGQPCQTGTVCTENPEVGVWSCPVGNGDWDYCCRSGHHCGYSEGFNYPWCYVGSADRDQWRPCSESYQPYAHSGRKLHWPVAYLHREGPPNVTLEHKPSIVDRFLNSLDQLAGHPNINGTGVLEMVTISPEPRGSEKETAMTKLWMWGKEKYNNLTSTDNSSTTTVSSLSSTPVSTTVSSLVSKSDSTVTTTTTPANITTTA